MNKTQIKKKLDNLYHSLPDDKDYTITILGDDTPPIITNDLGEVINEIPPQKGPINFIISIGDWEDE